MSQLVKKLSAKTIIGNVASFVKENIKDDNGTALLYTIFGVVNGVKSGSSNFGDWMAFQGSIEAVSAVTGETYRSPQVFLSEPLQGMLAVALQSNDTVEFACEVMVKRRDDLVIGYEYIINPKTETAQNDPLEHLRKIALPAPEAPAKSKK